MLTTLPYKEDSLTNVRKNSLIKKFWMKNILDEACGKLKNYYFNREFQFGNV
jgi:hypothetical protein